MASVRPTGYSPSHSQVNVGNKSDASATANKNVSAYQPPSEKGVHIRTPGSKIEFTCVDFNKLKPQVVNEGDSWQQKLVKKIISQTAEFFKGIQNR